MHKLFNRTPCTMFYMHVKFLSSIKRVLSAAYISRIADRVYGVRARARCMHVTREPRTYVRTYAAHGAEARINIRTYVRTYNCTYDAHVRKSARAPHRLRFIKKWIELSICHWGVAI